MEIHIVSWKNTVQVISRESEFRTCALTAYIVKEYKGISVLEQVISS